MTLHEVLASRFDDVISRWGQRVTDAYGIRLLHRQELLNSLPVFLKGLIEVLRRKAEDPAQSVVRPEDGAVARTHGIERLDLGFTIDEVVQEYNFLRESMIEVVEEAGYTPTLQEYATLGKFISEGIGEAVAEYARQKESALVEQNAEHLAFLSHELRNRLSSATLSASALIRLHPDNTMIKRLSRSLSSVRELIDNALMQLRALKGVEAHRLPAPASGVLQFIRGELETDAEDKSIKIEIEPTDAVISADPRLLNSALINLVGNAIRFTRPGGTVTLRTRESTSAVWIDVQDQCGGLPEGAVERMFTQFVQVGVDRTGFGLGLAIARQAVLAHGGRITVKDLPGEGCIFTVEIPSPPPIE